MKNVIKDAAQQYANLGLSVIPIKSDKIPAISWAEYQRTIMGQERIEQTFERSWVTAVGLVCGAVSGNLEVIDVDCKYDDTGTLGDDFLSLLQENLSDVYDGLLITKTVNHGYHIYYRCSEKIEGNQKLASRPDKSPLIETRGEGGYVIAPPSPGYELLQGDFSTIPTITSEQRELLFSIAKSFDESLILDSSTDEGTVSSTSLSPFEDFNKRGDVVAILEKHDWVKVKEQGHRIHFRRPGKTDDGVSGNFHTGYRKFYVFSTSTNFEAGKGHSPSNVYAVLECDGDLSKAAKQLYDEGYGERHEYVSTHTGTTSTDDPLPLLPIDGFPPFIKEFITTCTQVYGTPRDYWAGAVLISSALAVGDKIQLVDKYEDIPILWLCIVGDVSIGKTQPIKLLLEYFQKKDNQAISDHNRAVDRFERASRGEVNRAPENRPRCMQYIVIDSTPEAIAVIHQANMRGLLIYRDELKGWIDDFGRYSAKSGEQANMLSTFNRGPWKVNRKGDERIINIPKTAILVTGGMQPDLLLDFAKGDRAESGFLARFMFVYPDSAVRPGYTDGVVPTKMLKDYEEYLDSLASMTQTVSMSFGQEAKSRYIEWFNENDRSINEEDSNYLKGAYGKLPIFLARIAVIIRGMWVNESKYSPSDLLTLEEINAAIQITEYFRSTSVKVFRQIYPGNVGQLPSEKQVVKYLYEKANKNPSQIERFLGIHRQQVYRWAK